MSLNITNNITIEKIDNNIIFNIATLLSTCSYNFFLYIVKEYTKYKLVKYNKKLYIINTELDKIENELNNITYELDLLYKLHLEYEFKKI